MEPLDFAQFTGEDEELYYIVAKFGLVNGALHLRIVNGESDPAKNATNRQELEAVIAEHVKSDELYADPPMVFTKNEDQERCEAVIDAFYTWDDDES